MTATPRKIEIFSAGCPLCEDAITRIRAAACGSCDIQVRDMNDPDVRKRATTLGVGAVPAVAIDGKLSDCCTSAGLDLDVLRAEGLGKPIS